MAADYGRQKALLDNTLDTLKQAGLLASAPAGMALASGGDLQLSASQNLIGTSGGHADFSALKRFTVAAGELVSVFAQKLGIKLFAARGPIDIQAQSDDMRLLADQNVTISSAHGRVVIEAEKELLLKCGGSYLRLSLTGIEDGTRGDRIIRSASYTLDRKQSLSQAMNTWKHTEFDEAFTVRWPFDDEPASHESYAVVRDDGSRIRGKVDAEGRTSLQKSLFAESVELLCPLKS
ncbi:hypothetical protein D3C85_1019960 [compost metagenome]